MASSFNVHYLTDENGKKTAVQIPINDWLKINQKLAAFMEMTSMKQSLSQAFKEVKDINNGRIAGISSEDFLNSNFLQKNDDAMFPKPSGA